MASVLLQGSFFSAAEALKAAALRVLGCWGGKHTQQGGSAQLLKHSVGREDRKKELESLDSCGLLVLGMDF